LHRVPKVLASSVETWYLYRHAHSGTRPEKAGMTPKTDVPPTADAPAEAPASAETATADVLVEQDLLVEDVSIDGMCGVY
jgi:mycofactocin precursor